jgi:hypothetical protein
LHPRPKKGAAVAVGDYEPKRASWTEGGAARAVIESIAARVRLGRVVNRGETGLTVRYGSPAMFRLMGSLFTPKWFPITAQVSVVEHDQNANVEVVGTDNEGWYLASVSGRRGEPSIGEKGFIAQFDRVCSELSGSRAVQR